MRRLTCRLGTVKSCVLCRHPIVPVVRIVGGIQDVSGLDFLGRVTTGKQATRETAKSEISTFHFDYMTDNF